MSMEPVLLYVYDVTRGMARQISPGLLGRQIEGVWHTAIVAYGMEYFFGGDGINCSPPASIVMLGSPTEIVDLGGTAVPKDLFHEYLNQIGASSFRGDTYHLTDHNCNHFSNEVALFLTGNAIPEHIIRLPEDIFATPMGAMLKPMLDQMMLSFGPPPGTEHPHFGTPPSTANPANPTASNTPSAASAPSGGSEAQKPPENFKDDLDLD